MKPERMKGTGRVKRPIVIKKPPMSSKVPVAWGIPGGVWPINGRPAGKPSSLPVPCSRKRSPVSMRSTESISGARKIEPTIGSAGRETASLISFTFQPENGLLPHPFRSAPLWPSTKELGGGLGDQLTLMPRAVEFDFRRMALTLRAGNRRCAVGRATHDFVERALPRMAVGQAGDDQAEGSQV